ATYYYPGGGFGACGWPINDWDMAVALGPDHWDNGAHCGQQITVTFGGTTICAIVADECPGCQVPNGIDLTQGAMATLDPNWFAHGVDTVQWGFA
ncbi:RlpA-like double-psi beta-barrel-protein domain-containing protein-containing protein, partial [Mycena albidolilacea]